MRATAVLFALSFLLAAAPRCTAATVVLVRGIAPDSSGQFYAKLKKGMQDAGLRVAETPAGELAARLAAEPGPGTLLCLADATYFPVEAREPLKAFLRRGNHLIALSGPAFSRMTVRAGDKWLTQEQAKAELANAQGEVLFDFPKQDMNSWRRISGAMQNPTHFGVEPAGKPGVPEALHVRISKLDNWDTLISPPLPNGFPSGATATVFWAKGEPDTPEMVVEWKEKDGCRWMAVVKLTTEWVRYALTPSDFKYWNDNPAISRGGAGDHFHPENAQFISFGVASGISSQKMGIAHSFWVSDVRAVRDTFAEIAFSSPVLESLSPAYKTYATRADKLTPGTLLGPGGKDIAVTCAIPRGAGLGSDAPRPSRWIPLVSAYGSDGEIRGTAAHLFLDLASDYPGSVWGHVGCSQQLLERNAAKVVPFVASIAKRITRGVFLTNAGVAHSAFFEGEKIEPGAYLSNVSSRSVTAQVKFSILARDAVVRTEMETASIPEQSVKAPVEVRTAGVALPPGEYTLKTVLLIDGQPADEIVHPFRVVGKTEPVNAQTVTVRDGDFCVGAGKWHGLGMNYWPRYSMGQESPEWGDWLSPRQYNPELIEQDLRLARKLGINLLSIQYQKQSQARSLIDFLARADKHGIKLHIYMPGLHPLYPDFKLARALITDARLPQSSAFFAYDVGWEVHVGGYKERSAFDKQWQEWVLDQYGGVQSAERDWGMKPERRDGTITGPTDDQLSKDGPWRVYVAAYRRFWDDEISRRYRRVREFIREFDKVHLIGARSGYGGTGSMWAAKFMPFDLASGAKHLDFTAPEGYALNGDRVGFLRGGIITLYGRLVSAGKPVFWPEYGISIWPKCDAASVEAQRAYYENTLGMLRVSDANASAGWWWPGGFRLGENSDFGVTNPDGTPRPAALELRKFADALTREKTAGPVAVIEVDRDAHAGGIAGIFADRSDEYVQAVEAGKTPVLKTAGTGTTSADTPLVAVGNVPCNGSNPPKYLNAEFNWVKVNGQAVADGDAVVVRPGAMFEVEASVGNTGEATWLAPVGGLAPGSVWLTASIDGRMAGPYAIAADTPFLGNAAIAGFPVQMDSAEAVMTLRMASLGRTPFGEVFRLTLKPR